MKKHFAWLDALRGIGILLVVFGHQKPSEEVVGYLQLVMAPVFFFASGYLFDPTRYKDVGTFMKRRWRSLVIPYFSFAVISLIFWVIFVGSAKAAGAEVAPNFILMLLVPLVGIFYGTALGLPHNIPLWFLTCLFVTDALFFWLVRRVKTDKALFWWMVLISFGGFLLGKILPVRLPWNADIACSILVYYGAGYLFRRKWGEGWNLPAWKKALLAAGLLAVSIFFTWRNPVAHPMNNDLGRFIPYHLAAASSVLFFLLVSQFLARSRVLAYIGRNSLTLLGVHVMGMALFLSFARQALDIDVKAKMFSTPWAALFATGAIMLSVPMIYVINRYFPQILGKAKPVAVREKPEATEPK